MKNTSKLNFENLFKSKNVVFLFIVFILSVVNKFNFINYEMLNNDDAFEYLVSFSPNFDWFMLIAQRSVGYSAMILLLSQLGLSVKLTLFLTSTFWAIILPLYVFKYLNKKNVDSPVAFIVACLVSVSPVLGIYSLHLKNYSLEAFAVLRLLFIYSFPRKSKNIDYIEKIIWVLIVGVVFIPIFFLEANDFLKNKNKKSIIFFLFLILIFLVVIVPALFEGDFIKFYQSFTSDSLINNIYLSLMFFRSFYDGGLITLFILLFAISLLNLMKNFRDYDILIIALFSFVLLFFLKIYPLGTLKGDVALTPLIFIILGLGLDSIKYNQKFILLAISTILATALIFHLTAPLTAVQDSKSAFEILKSEKEEFSLFVDLSYSPPAIVYLQDRAVFNSPKNSYLNAWGKDYCLYGGKDNQTIYGGCLYQYDLEYIIKDYLLTENPTVVYFLFENDKLRFRHTDKETTISLDNLNSLLEIYNYTNKTFLQAENMTLVGFKK
jgi:hypothetical protein